MILKKDFFQAQNAVFDNLDLGLKWYEKLVCLYLSRCSNQGALAFPGYGGIAKRCGVSRATAKRAVKSLAGKKFITVTHRPKSNRDNESNLYQVNLLPSKPRTPPLVSHRPQSRVPQIPYKEPFIKNHSINKGTVVNEDKGTVIEDTGITPITGNVYPSGKSHAPNGRTSLTDKGAERKPNPPVAPTPLPLNTRTHADTIEAFIRKHGSLNIYDVPRDWDFRGPVLLNTVRNDPRFIVIGRHIYLKDNIPVTVA